MSFEESQEQPHAVAQKLRDRLLSDDLSPDDFLDQIFELDQSTPGREHAHENFAILTDEAVRARFEDSGDADRYHNLVSLSAFHIGQIKAMDLENPEDTFTQSLVAAERTGADYDAWKAYVAATLAYFQKDVTAMEGAYARLGEGANREIIGNMLAGLKSRGDVDYRADYRPS